MPKRVQCVIFPAIKKVMTGSRKGERTVLTVVTEPTGPGLRQRTIVRALEAVPYGVRPEKDHTHRNAPATGGGNR